MAKVTPIQTNFTAGEWSPKLDGRVDVTRYKNAAAKIENFIVAPFGGIDRRPGSVWVAPAKFPNKKVRLIPFQFSTVQSYIIEMGDGYMRFYRDNGSITETGVVISGASQADPLNLTVVSHGYSVDDEIIIQDVVGMTQLNNQRFRIKTVVGANNVELKDLDGNDVDSTGFGAYISGGTANKIVEITGLPILESQLFDIQFAQTADILYLVHQDLPTQKIIRMSDTSWSLSEVAFTGGPFQPDNLIESLTMTPSVTTGSGTITASSSFFNADMVDAIIKIGGEVSGIQGYAVIDAFTNDTLVDMTVIEELDGTGATDDWAIGSFSVDAGFPQAVGFHQQRLWLGGTRFEPQTAFASQSLIFENFTSGANDSDSLIYEIATEQVNAIRWISAGRGLAVGTSGGIFIISSGADFIPLTPTNLSVRRETTFGTELIKPKGIGNFIYYMQRGSRKVREFAYNFDIDSHRALDMTLLSEQITESGIVEMDFQQSPDSVLYMVRKDGLLATMTRQVDQEVIAWTKQITGATIGGAGSYESVAIIPIPDAEEDQSWYVVKRIIGGITRRFIEYQSTFDFNSDIKEAFFVDAGLSYDGVSTSILSNLNHLEGETVKVLNEGAVEPDKVVTNGQITLDNATTRAHVGLGYTSKMQSMKLEDGSGLGTAQGKISRVDTVIFRFFQTVGAEFGVEGGIINEIFFRNTNDPMDTATPLFTGDKLETFVQGYSKEPRVFVQQTDPLPLTLLALMTQYEVFEK